MHIVLRPIDATHMLVDAEPSVLMEMKESFSFFVNGYKFMPAYRNKMWDGRINLINPFERKMYVGLAGEVEKWAKESGYTIENLLQTSPSESNEFAAFLEDLVVSSGGDEILMRDYQKLAAFSSVKHQRRLLLSPTGSGKSLILYSLIRWHIQQGRKCLLVVPTIQLVSQMYSDFQDYSGLNGWDVEKHCGQIVGGKDKTATKPLMISTWQSLAKVPITYFHQFDVVMSDECHLASAKTLTGIIEKCKNAHYRTGTTGTLDGSKTHSMVLTGLLGPIKQVTTTKELMDADQLASLDITCLVLKYDDTTRKELKKFSYQEEIDWLISNHKRNKFITNLSLSMKGNTLVLFQFVEKHGQILYDLTKEKAADGRKIFFIHGGVDSEDRENVRRIIETENDAIIFASSQTTSTGVNFKNLHNIIYASPTKSRIRNLQSIGRGLRKGAQKTICKLFDIGDDLSWKSRENYTYKHMTERIKIFNEQQFHYRLISVDMT